VVAQRWRQLICVGKWFAIRVGLYEHEDIFAIALDIYKREFLKKLTIATALLPATSRVWAQQKFDKNPFSLGVASGSATHDSVVRWTRLYDQGVFGSNIPMQVIPVKWEIAKDEAFKQIVHDGRSSNVTFQAAPCPLDEAARDSLRDKTY
jgi:phosphodiesterase/alkaline phosphatase D-like protein